MQPHGHVIKPKYTDNNQEETLLTTLSQDIVEGVFDDAPQSFWMAVDLPDRYMVTESHQVHLEYAIDRKLADIPTMWTVKTSVVMAGQLICLLSVRGIIGGHYA